MTNEPLADHDAWETLAAADALHALDPNQERRFLDHLQTCDRCTASLDEFTLVAAQLGSLADSEPDEPPSWGQLRTSMLTAPRPTVVALDMQRVRRRPASRILAAAAAVVALSAGTVAIWNLGRGSSGHTPPTVAALSACQRQPGCRLIRLHNPDGANPAAVIVNTDRVTLVPIAMSNPPTGQTYALWQLPRDGSPILIAEFRDGTRQTASAPLPSDYADTAAFAVSEESTRGTPTRPTHVFAVGTAT